MSATLDPVVAQRPRLFGLAYRMLGSAAQAEDTVQEAYARWYAEPRTEVRNQAGFLTTVVTRLCLDHLKSARVQRERYPGPWLAEPLALEPTDLATPGDEASAEQELERLETISWRSSPCWRASRHWNGRCTCCTRCSTTATPRSLPSSDATRPAVARCSAVRTGPCSHAARRRTTARAMASC